MKPTAALVLLLCAHAFVFVEPANLKLSQCMLPKESGMCRAYIRKYFYNHHINDCDMFIFGGCGGNGNNFDNLETCRSACGSGGVEPELYGGQARNQSGHLSAGSAVWLFLGFAVKLMDIL